MSRREDPEPLAPDAELRAAYARLSQEQPSAALDDAIRAAARRAVHAGPHTSSRRHGGHGAAPAWWPFAAAATLAAIIVGVVQLAPYDPATDELAARMQSEPTAPAGTQPRAAAKSAAPAPPPIPPAPAEAIVSPRTAPPAQSAVPAPAPSLERGAPSPAARASKPSRQDAPKEAAARMRQNDAASAGAPAAFPATAPAAAHAEKREEPKPAARDTTGAPMPVQRTQGSGNVAPPEAPATAAHEAARASAGRSASGMAPSSPRPVAKSEAAGAPGGVAAGAAVPAFDAWVKAIEELVRAGRDDEARRELLRLRAHYPDRDADLPPRLRLMLPPR